MTRWHEFIAAALTKNDFDDRNLRLSSNCSHRDRRETLPCGTKDSDDGCNHNNRHAHFKRRKDYTGSEGWKNRSQDPRHHFSDEQKDVPLADP
eukprot:scaffold8553_cov111-Amphora_coffeaeformis.AAC.1